MKEGRSKRKRDKKTGEGKKRRENAKDGPDTGNSRVHNPSEGKAGPPNQRQSRATAHETNLPAGAKRTPQTEETPG